MRDYREWHRHYDDPASSLSWRLEAVRARLHEELDHHQGSVHVLSVCSGDGRDILGVLAERPDANRVRVTLLEVDPEIARVARAAAEALGRGRVEVRAVDAGSTDAYVGAASADVVLLVGIFGNISDEDIERTLAAAPQLCRTGASVLWSRGLRGEETNDGLRDLVARVGLIETAYAESPPEGDPQEHDRAALGSARYDGPEEPLVPGRRLFTFLR